MSSLGKSSHWELLSDVAERQNKSKNYVPSLLSALEVILQRFWGLKSIRKAWIRILKDTSGSHWPIIDHSLLWLILQSPSWACNEVSTKLDAWEQFDGSFGSLLMISQLLKRLWKYSGSIFSILESLKPIKIFLRVFLDTMLTFRAIFLVKGAFY